MKKTLLVLAALAMTLGAWAQPSEAVRAPRLTYKSVFEGYKPFNDEAVGSWKAANETVRQVGGWREYARESQPQQGTAAPAAPKPATPASSTQPSAHGGHGKH